MNKDQVNKELTELLGECWHEATIKQSPKRVQGFVENNPVCKHCNISYAEFEQRNDYYTDTGFFKLWNYAIEQEWWSKFVGEMIFKEVFISENLAKAINPENFANTIYEYLKER